MRLTIRNAFLAGLAFLLLPAIGSAKQEFHLNIDSNKIQHADIHVAKGETMNGDIATSGSVDVEGTVNGDVAALGGPVKITGEVLGDIAALGGPVEIAGRIKGELASLGGDVTLHPKSVVLGNVALLGGKLNKEDGAIIKGNIANLNLSMLRHFIPLMARFHREAKIEALPEKLGYASRLLGYVAFLAFTLGIGLLIVLLTAFLPKQVETVAGVGHFTQAEAPEAVNRLISSFAAACRVT